MIQQEELRKLVIKNINSVGRKVEVNCGDNIGVKETKRREKTTGLLIKLNEAGSFTEVP